MSISQLTSMSTILDLQNPLSSMSRDRNFLRPPLVTARPLWVSDRRSHLCRTADPHQLGRPRVRRSGAINHGPAHYHSGKTTICAARLIARCSAL